MPDDNREREISLSASDISRAAAEGVLSQNDADRLVGWAYDQRFNDTLIPEPKVPVPEQRKGFNLVTVLYYFGAMLMISACAPGFSETSGTCLAPPEFSLPRLFTC